MIHLIVDGYNLIRTVPALSRYEKQSLEAARDHLVDLLAAYRKCKKHKITVVFDGASTLSEFAASYSEKGIKITFSPDSKTADEIIVEVLRKEKERALAVSSDRYIITHAEQIGSDVIDTKSFYKKMIEAQMEYSFGKDESIYKDDRVHKRWETKKKGPSKRAPKKKRKSENRAKKL